MSGLLTMVGIDADPLAGREHILLSNLIDHAWASAATSTCPRSSPRCRTPLRKLGVYELEAFYPAKDRTRLAMTLNGLLACGRSPPGPRGRTWTSTASSGRPTGPGRRAPSSRSPTCRTRSASSWCRCCSAGSSPGCGASRGPTACGCSSTSTRSWGSCRPPPLHRPRSRSSRCSSRLGRSAWGWCSPPRTPWTSTTRAWPTPAPGSSGGCRPSRTGTGCWTACRRPAGPWTWPPRATRSAGWASGSSCCASPGPPPPRCSPPAGPCRTCGGRSPASRSPR